MVTKVKLCDVTPGIAYVVTYLRGVMGSWVWWSVFGCANRYGVAGVSVCRQVMTSHPLIGSAVFEATVLRDIRHHADLYILSPIIYDNEPRA